MFNNLVPLLFLLITFGCGKHISDPKVSVGSNRQTQASRSTNLTLQVDESVSTIKIFTLTRNAWFILPSKLFVKNGNAVGKKIKIFYNLLSNIDFEFQCTYLSTNQANSLDFEKCVSRDGHEIISNVAGLENEQFPMDKGSSVKLQLTNPSGTGIKIDSVYEVDWR